MKYQRPKGTTDLYGQKAVLYDNIVKALLFVAEQFNYQLIITPLFESETLFDRAIGSETDIMAKEIYRFFDKANRKLALRPEGTAGVVRAVIENKIYNNQNWLQRFYYVGNMYRYERPQKGRYREFHQFGVEALGLKSPFIDVEVMLLALAILKHLKLDDVVLHLNYFGSKTTKMKFQADLVAELVQAQTSFCGDCQKRLVHNPLRILDCKIDHNYTIKTQLSSCYEPSEKQYFAAVKTLLTEANVNFVINDHLVRGLDYYDGVIFEFISVKPQLGKSQNTLIGGGRYDHLCQDLGLAIPYPAIGFAVGIERLMLLLENDAILSKIKRPQLIVISQKAELFPLVFQLTKRYREQGYQITSNYHVYSEKQTHKFLKQHQDGEHILVFKSANTAFFYSNKVGKKIINFVDIASLWDQLMLK